MIWHEIKLVATGVATGAWLILGVTEDVLDKIPLISLGAIGTVALIWRLVKDNQADQYVRGGYKDLIEAERERADRAEKRVKELESLLYRQRPHQDEA